MQFRNVSYGNSSSRQFPDRRQDVKSAEPLVFGDSARLEVCAAVLEVLTESVLDSFVSSRATIVIAIARWVAAAVDFGEELERTGSRLLDSPRPIDADRESPADAMQPGSVVGDEKRFHSTRFDSETESAELGIPDEDVAIAHRGGEIDASLGQFSTHGAGARVTTG